ncbi:MAG: hypothetical protein CL920_35015 [Deltaproteobacteria bacterium]|nr:hypothetical protein [Deltaproteobacteria bacterium]
MSKNVSVIELFLACFPSCGWDTQIMKFLLGQRFFTKWFAIRIHRWRMFFIIAYSIVIDLSPSLHFCNFSDLVV